MFVRAFTSFQLMAILDENHHSFLILEHDPMLYEDAEDVVRAYRAAPATDTREATVLLYAPSMDPHLVKIPSLADRVLVSMRSERTSKRQNESATPRCRKPRSPWRQ